MTNKEKYNKAFVEALDAQEEQLEGLKYQDILYGNCFSFYCVEQ